MKAYILIEDQLVNLLTDARFCEALEMGGVSRWPYYNYAIGEYLDTKRKWLNIPEEKKFGFKDLARHELERYWTMELKQEGE